MPDMIKGPLDGVQPQQPEHDSSCEDEEVMDWNDLQSLEYDFGEPDPPETVM